MINSIIFDLGGVVQGLDWSPVVNSLLDIDESLDVDSHRAAFYYDRPNYFDLYSVGKISKEDFWRMVASRLCIDIKHVDRLSESFELIYSFVNFDLLRIIEQIKKKYNLFVLSNACPEIENKVVKDNIYVHLFDKIYFSHNIGFKKPEKEAYLHITENNEVSPEECLFIDNDMKNIISAQDIGINSILYKGIEPLKKDLYEMLNVKCKDRV